MTISTPSLTQSALLPDIVEPITSFDETYLGVYRLVLAAETSALRQFAAAPTTPAQNVAKEKIMNSRVLGNLLVELYRKHARLSEAPCATLVMAVQSGSGDANDNVYNVGRFYRDRLIRACMFPSI